MRNATNVLVVASFLWLLVSFWNRNELPGSIDYVAGITNEPQQTKTDRRLFEAVWDGVAYRVNPEYDYDLVGMIVSFRHHDENSRMHRLADDHLNMLDVCVVWGNNTSGAQLDKIDFWNGIFTCNVKTRDQAAWESFDMYQRHAPIRAMAPAKRFMSIASKFCKPQPVTGVFRCMRPL